MSVRPTHNSLPPLNALRAFEAAARLGGIAKAAEELCVTPGAVAQHIKALEAWAGAPLFARHAKGVTLNELGRRSAPEFTAAFLALSTATQGLRTRAAPRSVRIAALPSLAQLWLSPRMPALRAAFPEARLSITALEQPPDMAREGYDIAIFLYPDDSADGTALAQDRILPVCAPQIAAQIAEPADLARHLWLRDSQWPQDWENWLAATGCQALDKPESVSFSLFALAVADACNGAGILMGHQMLVAPLLQDGRLVAPIGGGVATGMSVRALRRAGDTRKLTTGIISALAGLNP